MDRFKILLVDDEEEFVQTLSERLAMRDLDSAIAHDGEQALEAVARDEPAVMVLDIKMPGIDGIEVLRRVKRANPQVQVVILTGHGSAKNEEQARKIGAFEYLKKPVDIDRLIETLRRAFKHKVESARVSIPPAGAGAVETTREIAGPGERKL